MPKNKVVQETRQERLKNAINVLAANRTYPFALGVLEGMLGSFIRDLEYQAQWPNIWRDDPIDQVDRFLERIERVALDTRERAKAAREADQ